MDYVHEDGSVTTDPLLRPRPRQSVHESDQVSPIAAIMRLHEDLSRARLDALERGVTPARLSAIFSETADAISVVSKEGG